MEDYKKKYEDALERMKSWARGEHPECFTEAQKTVEFIFPELKESKDERIRKGIFKALSKKDARDVLISQGIEVSDALAWLEKQGEQTLPSVNEHIWLYIVDDVLTWKNGIGQYLDNTEVQELAKKLCSKYAQKLYTPSVFSNSSNIENNKQEPVDEPKFKVGDWIIFTRKDGTREMLQVSDIIDDRYYFNNVLHGSWPVKECNETCHLWSIEDAKPGDVLASHECIVLFKEIDGLNIKCHCTYHFMNNPSFYVNTLQNKSAFHPATKGQRELLFQKVKEAGYKWENNQLEEINNKGFIDLGLPSGTLWATCNLGAEKETDFGKFFQWGDTQGYSGVDEHQFNWNDYKWGASGNLSKYNENDTKLILDDEDDPVFVATNGMFKMPTKEQLQELIDHTNHEWIDNFKESGVNGMKFINKKDNTKYIFIPAAGYCCDSNHDSVGSWGYVWSSSRDSSGPDYAWNVYCSNSGKVNMYSDYRFFGSSVRGVKNP